MSDKDHEHRFTFEALEAQNAAALRASQERGGIVKNKLDRNGRPPDWLYCDADEFIEWLEAQGK